MNNRTKQLTIEDTAGVSGEFISELDREPDKVTKLDAIAAHLSVPSGTTIVELCATTGWQQLSVRWAMVGALTKRGLVVVSEKVVEDRGYWIAAAVSQEAAA